MTLIYSALAFIGIIFLYYILFRMVYSNPRKDKPTDISQTTKMITERLCTQSTEFATIVKRRAGSEWGVRIYVLSVFRAYQRYLYVNGMLDDEISGKYLYTDIRKDMKKFFDITLAAAQTVYYGGELYSSGIVQIKRSSTHNQKYIDLDDLQYLENSFVFNQLDSIIELYGTDISDVALLEYICSVFDITYKKS